MAQIQSFRLSYKGGGVAILYRTDWKILNVSLVKTLNVYGVKSKKTMPNILSLFYITLRIPIILNVNY